MPARYRTKSYVGDGYYHIYNRGVEKRLIFLDEQDYGVFLSYLKDYLLPKDEVGLRQKLGDPNTSYKEKDKILKLLRLNNFYGEITFLAYCLMPNHFHFFLKQKSPQSIDKFMQSLATRYTMYFNRKYGRVGFLCQAVYKAVLVTDDQQFIYLSKYIHHQALASQGPTFCGLGLEGQPSSYPEYLGKRKTSWINTEEILSYFSTTIPNLSYQNFVVENDDQDSIGLLHDVVLED